MSEMPIDRAERVTWVLAATTPEEIQRRYDLWAADYDADLTDIDGYQAPLETAKAVAGILERDAPILDIGCGTGLVGESLAKAGFGEISGVDLSPGMIEQAKARGVYSYLAQHDLTQMLPFASGDFMGVTAVGVSHAMPQIALHEIARVLAPGGKFFFCADEHILAPRRLSVILDDLRRRGVWRALPPTAPFAPLPVSEPDIEYRVYIYESVQ